MISVKQGAPASGMTYTGEMHPEAVSGPFLNGPADTYQAREARLLELHRQMGYPKWCRWHLSYFKGTCCPRCVAFPEVKPS